MNTNTPGAADALTPETIGNLAVQFCHHVQFLNGTAYYALTVAELADFIAGVRQAAPASVAEAPSAARPAMKHWCDTCEGTGSVHQEHQAGCHVGGEHSCPDCDGKGYWTPSAATGAIDAREQGASVPPGNTFAYRLQELKRILGAPSPIDVQVCSRSFLRELVARVDTASHDEAPAPAPSAASAQAVSDEKGGA